MMNAVANRLHIAIKVGRVRNGRNKRNRGVDADGQKLASSLLKHICGVIRITRNRNTRVCPLGTWEQGGATAFYKSSMVSVLWLFLFLWNSIINYHKW